MKDEFTRFNGQDSSKAAPIQGLVADRWELLGRVGEGGMSEVYKARHVLMNKIGAVKFLRGNLSTDPIAVKRFQQEALTSSSLEHANIVHTYDCGVCEQGFYLILEFLEGVSLADILDERSAAASDGRGRLTPEEAVPIFTQICEGLDHAHRKGVVHRDIKPSNVMLVRSNANDPSQFTVKLVDFGIAKIMANDGSASPADHSLTRTGEVFGSPLYMSPEQCMGQKVDGRSDLYSVGCLIYETLVGRKPIIGKNPTETMMMHVHEDPDISGLDKLDHPGAAALKAIVHSCLRKSPDERFADMTQLKAALQDVPLIYVSEPDEGGARRSTLLVLLTMAAVLLLIATSLAAYALLPVNVNDSLSAFNPPASQVEHLLNRKISAEKLQAYELQAARLRGTAGLSSDRPILDRIHYLFLAAKSEILCSHFEEAGDTYKEIKRAIQSYEENKEAVPGSLSLVAQAALGESICHYLAPRGSVEEADYSMQTLIHDYGQKLSDNLSRIVFEWQARIKLKENSYKEGLVAVDKLLALWPHGAAAGGELTDLEGAETADFPGNKLLVPADPPSQERRALWMACQGDLLRINNNKAEAASSLSEAAEALGEVKYQDAEVLGQIYYRLGLAQAGQDNRAAVESFRKAAAFFSKTDEKMHQSAQAQIYLVLKRIDWLGALVFRMQNGV